MPDDLYTGDLDLADQRHRAKAVERLAVRTASRYEWAGLFNVMSLSTSLDIIIESHCPVGCPVNDIMECAFKPKGGRDQKLVFHIMWTRENLDNQENMPFEPDHVVALITSKI